MMSITKAKSSYNQSIGAVNMDAPGAPVTSAGSAWPIRAQNVRKKGPEAGGLLLGLGLGLGVGLYGAIEFNQEIAG